MIHERDLFLWPPVAKVDIAAELWKGPRHFQLSGLEPQMAEVEGFDSGSLCGRILRQKMPAQHYTLKIASDILIVAGDDQGLRYALRTLKQLMSLELCPQLQIQDGPKLLERALMLDVSRDRIPSMEHFFEMFKRAAALKANHVQLYLEHSFAYEGHDQVWEKASPITPEELKTLDAYAQDRGITLSVCQNCFGHVERWLKHPPYAEMGNFSEDIPEFQLNPSPLSFNPSHPNSVELPLSWGRELQPCLSSALLNFGGDETVDLGKGASEAIVKQQGYGKVYGDHLMALARGFSEQGWSLQFWADIALEHPEILRSFPKAVCALAWGYEADSSYEAWGKVLQKLKLPWWACPGTSAWRSLVGRRDARSGSIRAALRAALNYGAEGMMITEWGDEGHRQTMPWCWLGWSEGLAMAWVGDPDREMSSDDWSSLSKQTFPDLPSEVAAWMDDVSAFEVDLRKGVDHPLRGKSLINANLPFVDSQLSWNHEHWQMDLALWRNCEQRLQGLMDRAKHWLEQLDSIHSRELMFPLEQLQWMIQRALWRRELLAALGSQRSGGHFQAMLQSWLDRGIVLMDKHQSLWLTSSRRGGLEDSLKHFKQLLDEAEAMLLKLKNGPVKASHDVDEVQ